MATYNAGDFKKSLKVIIDNEPYLIVEADFVKPGKGQALYKCRLKNLLRGTLVDRTFLSGDRLEAADVREESWQYLYNDGQTWVFMHPENFEQVSIPLDIVGDARFWIKDEMLVAVTFWNDRAIAVTPPNHIELVVTYSEPAARGNTATNVTKPVTLETGLEINVPLFINTGDVLKIDTRTREYIERVKS